MSVLATSQLRKPANDVDIKSFNLEMRNKAGIKLVSAITEAVIDKTIDGASTLTITVDDDNARTIQRSGRLGRKVDVKVDGLWWTLVDVKKQGRKLTLVFEEREVNVLRYYSKFIMASRNNMTRAQFALRLIREVKEVPMKWFIPELTTVQKISDVRPGQILINAAGDPVTTPTPQSQTQEIPQGTKLTIKTQPATEEQIKNANQILQKGVELNANRKVLVASIMTAIDESSIINLQGGDRDSVGIFQQRASQGWPATRDIPTDAAAFFKEAIALDKSDPNLSLPLLCQGVQHSFDSTGSNYARYQTEAERFVSSFGITTVGTEKSTNGTSVTSAGTKDPNAVISNIQAGNYFTRGQLSQKNSSYLLTPENSWNCIRRLATEVNWRAFCVNGVIWFVSDKWLFKQKVMLRISEDILGIDSIDYDYDEGKRQAELTVTAHASRWSCPPGGLVEVFDMGLINGRWLVSDFSRSLFSTVATITLIKPEPVLPEPTSLSTLPQGFNAAPPAPIGERNAGTGQTATAPNSSSAGVVAYVKSQVGLPYQWGAELPGVAFDCSGLTQAAYNSVGISIPRIAQAQYDAGPKLTSADKLVPGDLVFFGPDTNNIEHVGVYIGNGAMIDAPHTGGYVRVDDNFMNWTDPTYVGATRPWQLKSS